MAAYLWKYAELWQQWHQTHAIPH